LRTKRRYTSAAAPPSPRPKKALDVAINDLEDASALLKLRAATSEVTGDNLRGPHYSLEDARDLHLAAVNYLIYLENSLSGHISQLID